MVAFDHVLEDNYTLLFVSIDLLITIAIFVGQPCWRVLHARQFVFEALFVSLTIMMVPLS
jgi:hypothetical protein